MSAQIGRTDVFSSAFFVANYDSWKGRYEDAKKVFRAACQGEIDLWNYSGAQKTTYSGKPSTLPDDDEASDSEPEPSEGAFTVTKAGRNTGKSK